jgi:PAS domain S-box-containing protein
MQLRYIDKNGMEIIRVDKIDSDKNAYLTPKDKLQNKSNRDYFIAVSSMNEVKTWHSKFDLNMEHGKVELPYNPTLRIAVAIIDEFKKFNGILMVNLSTKNLLKSISNSSTFEHYIVDKEANYIVHPDEKYSFNKYTGISRSIKKDFPKYTFEKLLKDNTFDGSYIYKLGDVIKNEDEAFLILKPKIEYQKQFLHDRILSTLYIVVLSILASIFMAFYASKKPSELQKALLKANKELRRFSKILDKYVVSIRTKKDSTIIEASSAFEVSSGYSKKELVGKNMNIIRHKDTPLSVISDLWSKIINNEAWDGEIKNRRKDGSEFWLEQHIEAIKDEKDEIESFF